MTPRRLFVSFSGGETSAFMTHWILANWRDRYDEIRVVFANTGQENEETLQFVQRCDEAFAWGVVWIEAVTPLEMGVGPSFRVVNHNSASRAGEPFEESIQKYGIPNKASPHCTRALKVYPLEAYLRSEGWATGTYDTAIGIRADEVDRISVKRAERRLVYPLIKDHPMTKPQINAWWRDQSFRLRLTGYRGNCVWCWKKTTRKHFTIISETPEVYDFPRRMEALYSKIGPEFKKPDLPPDYERQFFRGNASTTTLFGMYRNRKGSFQPAEDDAQVYPAFDPELDTPEGSCVDSCEVYGDEEQLPLFDLA